MAISGGTETAMLAAGVLVSAVAFAALRWRLETRLLGLLGDLARDEMEAELRWLPPPDPEATALGAGEAGRLTPPHGAA